MKLLLDREVHRFEVGIGCRTRFGRGLIHGELDFPVGPFRIKGPENVLDDGAGNGLSVETATNAELQAISR